MTFIMFDRDEASSVNKKNIYTVTYICMNVCTHVCVYQFVCLNVCFSYFLINHVCVTQYCHCVTLTDWCVKGYLNCENKLQNKLRITRWCKNNIYIFLNYAWFDSSLQMIYDKSDIIQF